MSTVLDQAQDFMWHYARLLDRSLFAHLYQGGSRDVVIRALRAYQNDDGGFGHALEPDKRVPDSQPVDVEMALHILDIIAGFDDPMVGQILQFLPTITTPEGGVPFALPSVMNYPRAPWWNIPADPPASLNPTAAIVGLLTKHGIQHPWIAQATAFCWSAIEASDSEAFHDLMPMITFLEHAADQPRAERQLPRIGERMLQRQLVAFDPAPVGYVKGPLDWAPTPASYCRRLFSDTQIAASLQQLQQRQQSDGGWPITWAPISQAVAYEWRGWVTIEALRILQAYGVAL